MNAPATLRFVSGNRRVREDRRFVVGRGHYVADVALAAEAIEVPKANDDDRGDGVDGIGHADRRIGPAAGARVAATSATSLVIRRAAA